MSLNETDFKNLVITSLSQADPSVQASLEVQVPRYWTLWARQGVLPELRYWYVRREAIRYLMGGVNRQIDYLRREENATRASNQNSRQDSSMTAGSHEDASSLSNRDSSSTYADETNSIGSSSASSNRSSSQSSSGLSNMTDTGSGANSSSQNSSLASTSTVNASASDSNSMNSNSSRHLGGGHYFTNGSNKVGGQITLGAGGGSTDLATNQSENGTIVDDSTSSRTITYQATQTDQRANTLALSSNQSSNSHFTANMHSVSSVVADSSSHAASDSSSTRSLEGSGSGSMTGTGAGSSVMAADGTRAAVGTGESHQRTSAQATTNSQMEKLSQRFTHLREMWKRANDMIEWFEKERLRLAPYVLKAITLQYPEGANADVANQFLVQTPYGPGGI